MQVDTKTDVQTSSVIVCVILHCTSTIAAVLNGYNVLTHLFLLSLVGACNGWLRWTCLASEHN